MKTKSKATKFPLLIYHRYHQIHRGLSIALIALGLVLAATAGLMLLIRSRSVTDDPKLLLLLGIPILALGLARYLLTLAFSKLAYVQCTPRNIKIQTPIVPVVFSYRRIADTRPTNLRDVFPPNKQKGVRRKMLEELWGETVIVVELKGYPMPKSWLKTLMGPYLLTPKGTGFVFLVKDWMGLNRQIADYLEQWRARASKTRVF